MNSENLLSFQEDGTPYSHKFNDIYFDTFEGFRQSQETFIIQNKIYERLLRHQKTFTIIETGFGTGLNFLLTLQVYQKIVESKLVSTPPQLHFISVEKYPLNKKDLKKSLTLWPELAQLSDLLVKIYPSSYDKNVTLSFFNGQVSLTLLFGDAAQCLSELSPRARIADAWYLDGFSPRKNPDMWSPELFKQIERLSQEQASLATFTLSGDVRRELIKAGFRVEKVAISGKKKQCMRARFQQGLSLGKGYQIRPKIIKPMHAVIIGGGIAAACAAYALTKKGIKVVVYCKDNTVAQGASSNKIGALFPLIHQQKDDISEFYETAFYRARELYDEILSQGFHFAHNWCGLLEVAYKESLKTRQTQFENIKVWPECLIQSLNQEEASNIANIPLKHGGLFMPKAGWIAPVELVNALFTAAKKTNRLKIETQVEVNSIEQLTNNQWKLNTNKADITASTLIICAGAHTAKLNIVNHLPLTSVRGQVSNMKAHKDLAKLNTVICHKGYLTPAHNNIHCIGASFEKNTFNTEVTTKEDRYNFKMLNQCLPELNAWTIEDVASSKARLRCMTPDHLPMVGVMPKLDAHKDLYAHLRKDKNWKFYEAAPHYENLYVLTGLGARGLCTAPLLADILAADLSGSPYPVDNKMLFNLSPNRFVIRDLIKRKI